MARRWYWPFGSDTQAAVVAPPQEAPAKAPPSGDEVVIAQWRERSRAFITRGITPEKLRRIFDDADNGYVGDLMELLDDVAQDPKFGSVLRTAKLAVAGASWHCKPPDGDESERAAAIAQDAERFLGRIPGFQQLKLDLLDAIYRGFAAVQPTYSAVNGRWDIVKHKAIESRFFRFDGDQPHVLTEAQPMEGEPLPPPPSVLWHVSRSMPGPLTRAGIGRALAKLFCYKGLFVVDLASYLERFGHPLVQAEYPAHLRENTAELDRIKKAAKAFAVDMSALVPQGTVLKLIEAIGKGQTVRDVYLAAIEWCDDAAAVCALGGALTTGRSNPGIGQGREAEEHGEVRQEWKELCASQLEDTITSQLLRAWTTWHYGANAPCPRLCIEVAKPENELEKAQARKTRAETRQIYLAMGVRQSLEEIYAENEMNPPASDEDALEPKATPEEEPDDESEDAEDDAEQPSRALSSSSSGAEQGQAYTIELIRATQKAARDALSPDLADLLLTLRAATSFDDLRERVVAWMAEREPAELADLVHRSRLMAELVGRYAVLVDVDR